MRRMYGGKVKNIIVIGLIVMVSSFAYSSSVALMSQENEARREWFLQEEMLTRLPWSGYGGELEYQLTSLLEEYFGGVWIDEDGRMQVGLIDIEESLDSSKYVVMEVASRLDIRTVRGGGIEEKRESIDIRDGIDVIVVEHSWNTLVQTVESIHNLHQHNVDLERGDWPIQVEIMTDINRVHVYIPYEKYLTEGHKIVLREIEARYADQVIFTTGDTRGGIESCNWWFCDSPLRGGVLIRSNTGNQCTAGFIMRVGTIPHLLTAGHCGGTQWYSESYHYVRRAIGNVTHNIYLPIQTSRQSVDAMLISINRNNWGVSRGIYTRGVISGNTVLNGVAPPVRNINFQITTVRNSVVGERVCISGSRTGGYGSAPQGGSCGRVHAVNMMATAGGVTTRVHRAGMCTRSGDSGAPVYDSAGRAHGIHRGWVINDTVCSDNKIFTPMNIIIDEFRARNPLTVFGLY